MQILLATHFYPPGHLGGTEVLTAGLARSLRALGHDVHVICSEDWDVAPGYKPKRHDEVVDGVPVTRLRFNWKAAPDVFRYLYDNPETERCITEQLRRQRPDVMHVTSCYSLSASILTAARRERVPVLLSATDFWFLCARNTLLHADGSLCTGPDRAWKCATCMLAGTKAYEWPRRILPESLAFSILRALANAPAVTNRGGFRAMLGPWPERVRFLLDSLRRLDLIVTASAFLKDLFVRYGVDPSRIEHSSYGLDTEWARGMDTKSLATGLRVGFIGQLVPIKGPDLLIRAVRFLPPDVRLQVRLYGDLGKDPPYGRSLEALAAGDDRITFCGTFPNERMGEVLREIDVLVVPSVWYDFPLVIPSAFATRTPVIATDLPGMNELVTDGVTGFLFARGSTDELSRQLGRIAENPEALESMRPQFGRVKNVEQMAVEYVGRYERLTRHR